MVSRKAWAVPTAAVLVAGMLTLGGSPAVADDDPIGGLTTTLQDQVHKVTSGAGTLPSAPTGAPDAPDKASTRTTPSSDPGTPSSSDESPGHDVADPQAPDHGGADVLQSQAGGTDAVGAGHTNSTVEDDDSTHSDADLLTIGGEDVTGTGAHASSDGTQHASSPTTQGTDQVCSGSSGQLCLDVLYADASATDNGSTSDSRSESELVGLCAGGTETSTDTSEACDGPVQAGAAGSNSAAHRNQRTGRTTATSGSYLFDVCLSAPSGGLPGLPQLPASPLPLPSPGGTGCALGLDGVQSTGHADSSSDQPQRASSLLVVSGAGQQQEIDTPEALELPPGCPAGTSALCAYLNQGESYLGADGLAGTAQEAVNLQLLPGVLDGADLLGLIGVRSETLVHNDGGETTPSPVVAGDQGTPAGATPGAARAPVTKAVEAAAAPTGGLPNTGGPSMGLLSAGLLAAGAGAILVAASRLRRFGLTTT